MTYFRLACRGFTGHEHLVEFDLINANGRLYDPTLGQFMQPDNYVQMPESAQSYNRYAYCLNNPLKYTDPSGELVWFVPVIIGAVVGAYTGASIQSRTAAFWNWKPDAWKGAIVGGLIGAAGGALFSSAIGATGMTTVAVNGTTVASTGWGITSTSLSSSMINMGMSVATDGNLEATWKSGIIGAISGIWAASGGFGLANGFGTENGTLKLISKLAYQNIGTGLQSMGNNWIENKPIFSKYTFGFGPINLSLGHQPLLQWQNNIANIGFNAIGLANLFAGGTADFNWSNLTPIYKEGFIGEVYKRVGTAATGAHAVFGINDLWTNPILDHEMGHIWQSRALNDKFLFNYIYQVLHVSLMGEKQYYGNWWEYKAQFP
jgi:RHS repeat-associated protein